MEEEIELRELIEILLKRKKIILIFTLGAILLSMVYSFVILEPTYEAKMVLMASNRTALQTVDDNKNFFLISNPEESLYRFNSSNLDTILNDMSQGLEMNMETYKQQLKSSDILSKTIEELNLGDKYSVDSLGNIINIEMIKDTQLIAIKMEHSDPAEAADIVNSIGDNFIATITNQYKQGENKVIEYVETQMEIEKKEYEDALSELKITLSQPRSAKELKLELDSNFAQITEYKAKLNDLEVNSNTKIESIKSKIEEITQNIQNLQIDYQDKEYEESIVRNRRDMAKQAYEYFLSKSEELRLIETTKDGESNISIISKANPASSPIGPRKTLNLAIGTVLGLMMGVFVAFFKEYWDTSSKDKTVDGGKIG